MSTTDKLQTIGLIVTSIGLLVTIILAVRIDRAQRRGEQRQQAADEWDEAVTVYADHIVDGLREHVEAKGGDLFPEYPVPQYERKLARDAVARGLLSAGTTPGQVTLPNKAATPTISGVGLYHRG